MMEPIKEYIAIIHSRLVSPLSSFEYGENHHIIPRACGGGNEKWNLVKLTPEEHYRCHSLLPFIYAEGKTHRAMVKAWWLMAHTHEGVEISEGEYDVLKREHSRVSSELMKGKPGFFAGHRHSEEAKALMSEHLKGRPAWNKGVNLSEETKRKMSKAHKGKSSPRKGVHLSDETKRKLSESHKGKNLGPRPATVGRNISMAKKNMKFTEAHKQALKEAWVKRRARMKKEVA